ncbi:hypothetical protein ACFFMN_33980 [Planobispora siamensis]|uniref:Uncharacterized protein n=1 Tax=Planobispora siamensis TaxID=936338 RepID=A0A8J3WLL0_9ACTN|nr:hypothetical protein [Planobispora siamensis]GIH91936.1 hypothetical protein Psi01_25660 [Planobispora siamensis]
MAATPIAPVQRYYPKGTLKWYWVPTIANKNAPTRSELNAGVDLTGEVAAYDGWGVTSNFLDAPDVNSRFTSKVPADIEAEDSSLTMYADPSGNDARTVMPRDEDGNIVRMGGGDIPGRKMDVFPVTVGSISKPFEMDAVPVCVFQFAITDEPAEDITIPA